MSGRFPPSPPAGGAVFSISSPLTAALPRWAGHLLAVAAGDGVTKRPALHQRRPLASVSRLRGLPPEAWPRAALCGRQVRSRPWPRHFHFVVAGMAHSVARHRFLPVRAVDDQVHQRQRVAAGDAAAQSGLEYRMVDGRNTP
jgi:hypothetical protein